MSVNIAVGNVCGLFVSAIAFALLCEAAEAQTAFYAPAEQELAGQPGSIIRTEPLRGGPNGATAYRVLYRSTGLHDEPTAVSGVVVVPAGLTQDDRSLRGLIRQLVSCRAARRPWPILFFSKCKGTAIWSIAAMW